MSCLTFALLLAVFSGIGIVQIVNSQSKAGELARLLAAGLIARAVGRHREQSPASQDNEKDSIG